MGDWADEKADLLIIAGLTRRNIADALREARAMGPEWRDISEAPKDGTVFLGFFSNGEVHVVYILEGKCRRQMDKEDWEMPTHWTPLPAPPKETP